MGGAAANNEGPIGGRASMADIGPTTRSASKELDGRVACKLSADNHGPTEWWLLLDPVASSSS